MSDRSGQIVGNYRLIRLLGRGGFAEVYLGQHLRIASQQAAIKILAARLQDADASAAFTQEAEIIASLIHPHIIRILDFDIIEDSPYLVMDYAAAGSLRQRHKRGEQVPLSQVVSYVRAIASGLHYAHERKIIHRDVKPDNMLLVHDELVLSDFGIATIAHSTHSLSAQATSGTIPYMAPEQIEGRARLASDQYALGISAYEWLTGERPFTGTFTEIAVKHTLVAPAPLREKVPELAPEVEQVILKALAKDPRQRFATVQDFASALEDTSLSSQSSVYSQYPTLGWQKNASPEQRTPGDEESTAGRKRQEPEEEALRERVVLEPVPLPAQSDPNSQRSASPLLSEKLVPPSAPRPFLGMPSRKWVVPLALLALLLLGGGSYALFGNRGATNAAVGSHPGAVSSQQGQATITLSYLTPTPTAARHAAPTATATPPPTPTAVPDVPGVPADASMFGYNAQHTRVSADTMINAHNVARLTQAWTASTGDMITNAAAVANGVVYVASKDGALYAFDAQTGQKKWAFTTGGVIESAPAVANGLVYIGSDDYNLYALNAANGGKQWTFHTQGYVIGPPTVANGLVYFASGDQHVYGLDTVSGTLKWSVSTPNDIETAPAIANGMVYIGGFDGHVYAFNATNGQQVWSFLTSDHIFSSPAVVNGVVYVGSNDTFLYALNATNGQKIWSMEAGDSIFSSPAVANGIVYVGSQDNKLYAVDATSGSIRWKFPTGGSIFSSPIISNGIVYISSQDHKVYALDATSGQQLWAGTLGAKTSASPIIANGTLYVGAEDHQLYAFRHP